MLESGAYKENWGYYFFMHWLEPEALDSFQWHHSNFDTL
jgi:hypothetical protein